MTNVNNRGQLSLWTKVASAVVAGCALLLFQTYLFTSLPDSTKYKIYRFQFGIVLNIVFYSGSKFLWRRLVKDVLSNSTSNFSQITWKVIVLSFIFFAHFSPFTNYFVGKEPSLFNMISWTCFASYIVIFTILWFTRLAVFLAHSVFPRSYINFSHKAQSIFAVVVTVSFTWIAFIIANSPPTIISVDIPLPKLPLSMNNTKIALLSDVHLGPTVGFKKLDRVVKLANTLHPDIVVFAGDLMDITVHDALGAADSLKDLTASLGKYYVTGNHEYYTGDVENWMIKMKEYGFTVLHNSNKRIYSSSKHDDWFCLLGTDDIQANQIRYHDHGMDLEKAYNGCDEKHASVLIAHQPKAAKMALDSQFDIGLVLSGHTHGGQIIPIRWIAYFVNPFLNGLYQYKNSYVYVSQGSVYYGFPLRLGSHPEITNITLIAT